MLAGPDDRTAQHIILLVNSTLGDLHNLRFPPMLNDMPTIQEDVNFPSSPICQEITIDKSTNNDYWLRVTFICCYIKAALALDPNHSAHNVNLHLGLCIVLVKLGRGKDAISSCSEALEFDGELIDAGADRNIREVLMRAKRSLKLSQRKDWYNILGVSKTSSVSEIKKAYKMLALQWHPEKNVDNREEAENRFREIAAAYEKWENLTHVVVMNAVSCAYRPGSEFSDDDQRLGIGKGIVRHKAD
ncbi:hypothetical protein KY285_011112 [Solanum tuberosum]|nr:hypothetical protein KY285_011112 [Solanum tuberosum]